MNNDKKTARILGAAFIFVAVASVIGGSAMLDSRVWSGSISDNLLSITESSTLMQINIMGELLTSIGIIVLASLLYFVFYRENKIIALVALGWWLAEAITLAMSRIPAFALANLGQQFVEAGTPNASYYQTLGSLFFDSAKFGYSIHMVFFCLGAILWYTLFYKTNAVPRALSVWGLAAVSLVFINELLWLFDPNSGNVLILLIPYAPFEFVLGIWLIVKGFNSSAAASESAEIE